MNGMNQANIRVFKLIKRVFLMNRFTSPQAMKIRPTSYLFRQKYIYLSKKFPGRHRFF